MKQRRMKFSMPVGRASCWSAHSTRSAQNVLRKARPNLFEALSPFLGGTKPHTSYQEVADRMNLGLGAVKTLIYRLRQQFASAVRREIMQTVSAPHEVDDELRRLRSVFARAGQQAF